MATRTVQSAIARKAFAKKLATMTFEQRQALTAAANEKQRRAYALLRKVEQKSKK
jgi:hypothetical protein